MTTPLHPSNYLSFSKVPLLVTGATTPLSPQILTPPLIFQAASPPTSGASLAPPPALLPGPHLHPHSNCGLSPSTPHCLRGSPEDPVYSLHFSGHFSCPHTGVCHKVLVREEMKTSPGSREHPNPDQEFRALPSELLGKGERL